jgi:ethanolamine phosphate transferase 2 subunit G
LAVTQSRATNIPLYLLFSIQHRFLETLVALGDMSVVELATGSLLLQHASFFATGGSNAISSIDLSSAYNGVAKYNAPLVGGLTFVSNWAGPLFWAIAMMRLVMRKTGMVRLQTETGATGLRDVCKSYFALLTVFTTASVVAVMAACTLLRTHLFIWTVFSPKYLYCMAWSLVQHLLVHVPLTSDFFS